MNDDPRVQRIIQWRESLTLLPDEQFFNLIRMYLGEIQTPYNKQTLIEQLSAFLRKEENKKNIVHLLTYEDIKLLSAVKFIDHPDQKKLGDFFSGTQNFSTVYSHIVNLEDRLVLYSYKDKLTEKYIIGINPLMEAEIFPLLSLEVLQPKEESDVVPHIEGFYLTPEFIASGISFLLSHHDILKADRQLKKRALNDIEVIFGSNYALVIQKLVLSFISLNLFREEDKGVFPNWEKIIIFANMPYVHQVSYICMGACGRFSRRSLQKNTQLLINTFASIGDECLERQEIEQIALSIKENFFDREESRFEHILAQLELSGTFIPSMLDNAVIFGILRQDNKEEDRKTYFVYSSFKTEVQKKYLYTTNNKEVPKVLSIDSGFSITIMPGLKLEHLLPLVRILDITHYDVAPVFEISRKSITRAFEDGSNTESLVNLLQSFSAYPLPQNLTVSIEEWFNSYSSATLYKGYVLKLNSKNSSLVVKNPRLSMHIKAELAPDVFLLDFESDAEAQSIISRTGFDFIKTVNASEAKLSSAGLPMLDIATKADASLIQKNVVKVKPASESEQKAFLDSIIGELQKQNLTQAQYEGLMERINKRIIVSSSQLVGTSVRFEQLEAGGMDYTGKLHVIENALQSKNLLQIELEKYKEPLIGKPLSLSKKTSNIEVLMSLEPDNRELSVLVSAIVFVKKIHSATAF